MSAQRALRYVNAARERLDRLVNAAISAHQARHAGDLLEVANLLEKARAECELARYGADEPL